MLNTITVTGKDGPGLSLTAQVFSDVVRLDFDYGVQVLFIHYKVNNDVKIAEIDLSSIATVTYTISLGSATITVST